MTDILSYSLESIIDVLGNYRKKILFQTNRSIYLSPGDQVYTCDVTEE